MEHFDINQLFISEDGGRSGWVEPSAAWPFWCLGHNFDIVGAIMSVASLSWDRGFEAGRTIANFAPDSTTVNP